jgi:hypothetical protein
MTEMALVEHHAETVRPIVNHAHVLACGTQIRGSIEAFDRKITESRSVECPFLAHRVHTGTDQTRQQGSNWPVRQAVGERPLFACTAEAG